MGKFPIDLPMTEASSPVEQAPFAFDEVVAEVVASGKWDLQKAGQLGRGMRPGLKGEESAESQGFWDGLESSGWRSKSVSDLIWV